MKNTLFKKILVVLAVITVSCGDKLDPTPANNVTADQAKKNIELLVAGAYGLLGSGAGPTGPNIQEGALYGTDLLLNGDLLASENYMSWAGTFSQYDEVAHKEMSSTNSSVVRMWSKAYSAINLANIILANLSNAPEDDRDRFKGHALFIRGVVQFELLRFWADPAKDLGIPLVTAGTEKFEDIKSPARATIADSYEAVISDLTQAKALLPDNDDDLGNAYSASAFLARVYLQKGDYAEALDEANNVIESGNYVLPASVEAAFNTTSPEAIFEIQQTTQNNAGTSNDGLTTFYACDPKHTPGSTGRGDVQIDSTFIDLYEPDDKRMTKLIYEGTCSKGSVTSAKWKNPYTNIAVIRLSEMYLVRAECNIRLGLPGGADATPLDDVNAIRQKAGASLFGAVTLDDVLNERDLELAFEGQRIHDYKRTGKIVHIVPEDPDEEEYDVDYNGPEFVLPIPQSQINTNRNIEQNTFYQ
jgi:tetratricopeptide (TPR) repeat protein